MIVLISGIPDDGMVVDNAEAIPRPFADPAWRLEHVHLTVRKDGDDVLVLGRMGARVPQTCARCLETFHVTVAPAVDARFVPAPAGRGEEHELGADDLETDVYSGNSLDLASLVETETTLALPMKPLCADGCRGLCPVCGTNRNATVCGCTVKAPDPRWAALQGLAGRLAR
jgi:DUF177 domain-containing protein